MFTRSLPVLSLDFVFRYVKTTKKTPGKGGLRFWRNVGLGFKTPKEAIEGEPAPKSGHCGTRFVWGVSSRSRPRHMAQHTGNLKEKEEEEMHAASNHADWVWYREGADGGQCQTYCALRGTAMVGTERHPSQDV